MPEVSIIIPIYNTDKYLEKCLNSVINQTLKDIEIILVNDGSTDNSEKICRKMAEIDMRIKYIHQENSGVVAARKKGVENATAEYVGFVDSDDWVSEDYYEKLLEYIKGYDLVSSGIYHVDNIQNLSCYKKILDNIPVGIFDDFNKMKYVIERMLYDINDFQPGIRFNNCTKLFKTSLAKKVFDEINEKIFFAEDAEFSLRYVLRCNSVRITDFCGYYYYWRENSCCNNVHINQLENINLFYTSLYKRFINSDFSDTLIKQLQNFTISLIANAPKMMGFFCDNALLKFLNPFLNLLQGKRIALYGAGLVGQNYYIQMKKSKDGEPVIWVDKNHLHYCDRLPVCSVNELKNTEYDYILIAIEQEDRAETVKKELIEMGFNKDIILWEKPYRIC